MLVCILYSCAVYIYVGYTYTYTPTYTLTSCLSCQYPFYNIVASLAIGALEPMLPSDNTCHHVVEQDIISIIHNIIHYNDDTYSTQNKHSVEPIDDDTLKALLNNMSNNKTDTNQLPFTTI